MAKRLAFDKHAEHGEMRDLPIADLKPWPQNYRNHTPDQVERIAKSLTTHGQRKSVVIQASTMRIIAGHGVVQAAQSLGWDNIRCDVWSVESDEQAAAYLVDDNELSRLAEDDEAVLAGILLDLQDTEYAPVSYDESELNELLEQSMTPDFLTDEQAAAVGRKTLAERFGVPPFSVLDARQGYWQDRKRAWIALGIQSELGRGGGYLGREQHDGQPAGQTNAVHGGAAPGGSMMPASKIGPDGKFARADLHMGKGKK